LFDLEMTEKSLVIALWAHLSFSQLSLGFVVDAAVQICEARLALGVGRIERQSEATKEHLWSFQKWGTGRTR